MPRSFKWSVHFRFSNKGCLHFSTLPFMLDAHLILDIWWSIQVMKLLVTFSISLPSLPPS
jgi:hypothetical protein